MSSIRQSHSVGEIQAAYGLYLLAMTNFCEAVKRSAKPEGYFWQSIVWEARGALDKAIYADGFIGGFDPFSNLSWWEYRVNYNPMAVSLITWELDQDIANGCAPWNDYYSAPWNDYYYAEDLTDHDSAPWNDYYAEDQTDHVHSWACGTYTMCPNCDGAHCQDALRCECGTWLTLPSL